MKSVVFGLAAVAALACAGCSCGNTNPEGPSRVVGDAGSQPLTINAGPDRAFCRGSSVVIGPAALVGYRYQWLPSTGLSSASIAQPTASPTQTTRYRLDVTSPDGATGTTSVLVTVRPLPLAQAGQDASVCSGASVGIGGDSIAGLSYAWSPVDGLDDAHIAAPHASPDQTTTYQLTVTDGYGCSAQAPVTLTVQPSPTVDPIASALVEAGGSATLSGNVRGGAPPYQLTWSSSDPTCTGSPCISDPSAGTTVVSPSSTSDFSLAVLDSNGCGAVQHAQVTVLAPLLANAGGDRGICSGDSIPLGTGPTGGEGPYTIAWTADVACYTPTCISDCSVAIPIVSPTQTTTFTELVTDALGAQASGTATVSVFPDPGVAGTDVYVVPGGSAQVGPAPVEGATYAWTCNRDDCALSSATDAQPLASPSRSTTYVLQDSSGPGCAKTSSATAWVGLQTNTAPALGDPAFPASSTLQVQFDQSMLATTFDPDRVQLTDANTGDLIPTTVSYDASSRTLSVRPPAPGTQGYAAGSDYTLTLTGGAAGVISDDPILPNILFGDLTLDYTTGAVDTTPPAVIYRTPPAGSTSAAINGAIQATFNEALDAATVNTTTFQVVGPAGPVGGAVSYDFTSHTATFVPSAPLEVFTTYAVTLANVADLSGNLGGDSWTFTTSDQSDTTPPTVIAVSPADGAVGVTSTTRVAITFSEPVYPGSFLGIRLRDQTHGEFVGGSLAYDALTQTVTFTPATMLAGQSTFEVQVAGVQDLAGNAIQPPFASHFSTLRTLFFDDFEHGVANWNLPPNAAGKSWSTQTRSFTSPTHSLTDSDRSKYTPGSTVAQTVAPIDVTGVSELTLEFALRTKTERNRDFFYVDYSVDGASWVEVDKPGSGQGWSGNGPWSRWTIPVPIPAGSSLSVRLRLTADSKKNFDGVYVDDVAVQAP